MNDNNMVLVDFNRLESLVRDSERLETITLIAWSDAYGTLDTIRALCGKGEIPWDKEKDKEL